MGMLPKFRLWNNIDSEYVNEVNAVMSLDGTHIWWDIKDSGDMKYDDNPDNYKVEQSSGLKDADGNEIYEGDVLATSSKIGGKSITDYLKVDRRDDYAGFFCGERPLYSCLSKWDNDIKYPQTFPKIVGNINENPNLLEGE